ncbi:MAG TPA: response regulator transcription factor [Phycisphaerae bacterium]|nr:response regulator transcription factor [Phycisphaerae bacterium]HPZ97877.1 response regulator transcription factor [Phycisphaerae bacterium]HQE28456.1 response regulator transcription factor [Phycisphaerae bacterium]
MIKILIADDHQLVRVGIRRLLEDEKDFKVIGEAADGKEAVELAKKLNPDVILMDVAMPGMDGMEATKRLVKKRKDPAKVVILTMHADEHYAARLLRMGASGYVVKDAAPAELAEAIRTVNDGKRFVSATLREALALRVVDGLGDEPMDLLTDREFQVLGRLASGATNREIAAELNVSVKTIDAHRLNLLAKLGLRNNAELTKFAMRHGVVQV